MINKQNIKNAIRSRIDRFNRLYKNALGYTFEEEPKIEEILACRYMILYAGIGSCSLAFTFQIFGQRYAEPSVAAVLMCLESVFSVIFGWLIIDDVLTKRALLGCAIMFAGVILTQLDFSGKPGRLPEKDNA